MPLNWLIADFETMSALDVSDVGAWRYAEDPTTQIICLGYKIHGGQGRTWTPGASIQELHALATDESLTWIAFNIAFERAIWKRIMVEDYALPEIPLQRWHDIQASAAVKGLPQNLDDLATELNLSHQKDVEGNKITLGLSKFNKRGGYDITPELLARVGRYCLQDVETEFEAHEALGFLPPGERRSWLLTQRTNERGIGLDMEYVKKCQMVVDRASPPLVAEFEQITGYKPGQNKKVMEWLWAQGANIPNLQKETLKNLIGSPIEGDSDDESSPLDNDGLALPDSVVRALRIRQLVGSASIKKLAKMEASVSSDGAARGLLHWHGTGPGRNAGRLLQPQNFPKPTMKADEEIVDPSFVVDAIMTGDPDYVEALIGPPIETVAGGLRHALKARPGRVFMSGDYAGIQARLVLAVAGQSDKTALMASGKDVYVDMASLIFRRPIDKKQDPYERGIGKNSVLGLGFQMGGKTFRDKYVRTHPQHDTAEARLAFCNEVVRVYRKEWAPQVPFVWYGLDDAAVKAVWDGRPQEAYGTLWQVEDRWLSCRLPSGRKMWYYKPTKFWNSKFDKDNPRRAVRYQALKQGRLTWVDMFGGKNTENIIMGMEADLLRDAQEKCEANNLPVVLDVHDELVVEPLEKDADEKLLTQIMMDVPDWVKQIKAPINVDTWLGDRYRK